MYFVNNTLSLPQTDYFHLFACVAIIVLYGDDVTEQQLATDQMLLHFSNLSMHMNGELVLRKVTPAVSLSMTMRYSIQGWATLPHAMLGYTSILCNASILPSS